MPVALCKANTYWVYLTCPKAWAAYLRSPFVNKSAKTAQFPQPYQFIINASAHYCIVSFTSPQWSIPALYSGWLLPR
jgi:hypothetical protein